MVNTKVAFYTLGCRANQYDTEMMKESVRGRLEYEVVGFTEEADVHVINTCSVTLGADRKSRQYIRRAGRWNGITMITGCYVTLDEDELKSIDGVDVIFSNGYKSKFGEVLDRAMDGFRGTVSDRSLVDWSPSEEGISKDTTHSRAFVKVQDGCSRSCTYCKVHMLRGPTRSKSISKVKEEAVALGKNDFSEIVLTGINLAEFLDGRATLPDLIDALDGVGGIERIRLSSINPQGISRELVDVFKVSRKTCPHFHIPLQSGSDRVLTMMERGYSVDYYLRKVDLIRSSLENVTFGTDVMVGFPGETEDDVRKTENVLKKVGYINTHVFRYSPREATPASNFDDKVGSKQKKDRSASLRNLGSSISLSTRKSFIGKEMEIVLEKPSSKIDGWHGHSKNYLDLHLENSQLANPRSGEIRRVRLTEVKEDFCLARRIESKDMDFTPGQARNEDGGVIAN